jgi:hypothetical protein
MQVRITVVEGASRRMIRVDGWLSNGAVRELRAVLASTPGPFGLVLKDLCGADPEGLALLDRVARSGVALDGLSPYLQLLLAASSRGDTFETSTYRD